MVLRSHRNSRAASSGLMTSCTGPSSEVKSDHARHSRTARSRLPRDRFPSSCRGVTLSARSPGQDAAVNAIVSPVERALLPLLSPTHLHAWASLETDERLPPRRPGIYAWYFARAALPAVVPVGDSHAFDRNWVLLCVGI